MDIFNKKALKEQLSIKCVLSERIRVLEKENDFMKTKVDKKPIVIEGIIKYDTPKKPTDIEKIQYELNYPRKYNLGDLYRGMECVKVEVNEDYHSFNHLPSPFSTSDMGFYKISGRTYHFKKDNVTMQVFEKLKK